MNKNLSTHIASFLSAAGATIALVHPGFQVPVAPQSIVVTLCLVISGILELLHAASKNKMLADVAAAEAWMKHLVGLDASPITPTSAPEVAPKA